MPLAKGVLAMAVFCAEVVKVAGVGVTFVIRETGTGVDVAAPCTLSPAVKMQRAMNALQTMLLRRSVPSWALLGRVSWGWPSESGHRQLLYRAVGCGRRGWC